MIYLILSIVIISLIAIIAFIIKYKVGSKLESALMVDKRVLEGKVKALEVEKGILIKHAADAKKKTIKSKNQLAEVKNEILKKYDPNNIDSIMEYINGSD